MEFDSTLSQIYGKSLRLVDENGNPLAPETAIDRLIQSWALKRAKRGEVTNSIPVPRKRGQSEEPDLEIGRAHV